MPAATCSRWFLATVFSNLKMEDILSSEIAVHARSTRCHIPEDGILKKMLQFFFTIHENLMLRLFYNNFQRQRIHEENF
jgi:hypothetical protein